MIDLIKYIPRNVKIYLFFDVLQLFIGYRVLTLTRFHVSLIGFAVKWIPHFFHLYADLLVSFFGFFGPRLLTFEFAVGVSGIGWVLRLHLHVFLDVGFAPETLWVILENFGTNFLRFDDGWRLYKRFNNGCRLFIKNFLFNLIWFNFFFLDSMGLHWSPGQSYWCGNTALHTHIYFAFCGVIGPWAATKWEFFIGYGLHAIIERLHALEAICCTRQNKRLNYFTHI